MRVIELLDDSKRAQVLATADPMREGTRIMGICNACRYCEGYCAVFPAMERRLDFAQADMTYLANLCHNCGECLYACQYAPPHEFGVNVPQTLARIRAQTWRDLAWPNALGRVLNRSGVGTALALLVVFTAVLLAAIAGQSGLFQAVPDGRFYRVMPHAVMATLFGMVGLFVLTAMAAGVLRAWSAMGEPPRELAHAAAWQQALSDVFTLRYLGRHATACVDGEDRDANLRRWAHHLTFYGFLLCFAATVVGTVYHFGFGWPAPYGYASLPVLLGTVGGIGLLIGPPLLHVCRRRADPMLLDAGQNGAADALILLLVLVSATGLALMLLRATPAMPVLLVVHLAAVMALFVVLPYGKFAHGFYRLCALLRYAVESRRPNTMSIGEG